MPERFFPERRDFLLGIVMLSCALLTLSAITFALYTTQELTDIKTRLYELEGSQTAAKEPGNKTEESKHAKRSLNQNLSSRVRSLPGGVAIHVVGDNTLKTMPQPHRHVDYRQVMGWRVMRSTGSIHFDANWGYITVYTPGYYFIYSQINYASGGLTSHVTLVNSKTVLRSITSSSKRNKPQTNYQGGVFLLSDGDRISIRIPFVHKRFNMNAAASYFGAFLVAAV